MNFKGIEIFCPSCKGELEEKRGTKKEFRCVSCQRRFPFLLGIPDLRVFSDPYIDAESDRAKGSLVGARLNDLSFSELVDYYYSITSVVPAKDARQYKRGLMAGVSRSEAAFANWDGAMKSNGTEASSLLEVGCGTGPLLVVAARRYTNVVGVDIAFRWLVVAKKRLAEAGLDIPLICACAEALPFRDQLFDRVVTDSTLEHVRDQRTALGECDRVLRPGGYLLVSTPNRYSLGPDPHVGIWAGGILPQRWVAAHMRKRGAIPPKRRLLSAGTLSRLIREAGFPPPHLSLPSIPAGQREYFGRGMNVLIDLYHVAKRVPISRTLMQWVGPQLNAVVEKPK